MLRFDFVSFKRRKSSVGHSVLSSENPFPEKTSLIREKGEPESEIGRRKESNE